MRRSFPRTLRRAASAGWAVKTGRTARRLTSAASSLFENARVGYAVDRLREPGAVLGADGGQLAAAVDLLGHVGQMEVGGERPDEADPGPRVELAQDGGGRLPIGADKVLDPLDEIRELLALLPDQGPSEQRPQLADVSLELALSSRGRCGLLSYVALLGVNDSVGHRPDFSG